MLIGLISCFVESFIPSLPLIGIVTGNAINFGLLNGMILSWIGSGLGIVLLKSLKIVYICKSLKIKR